MSAAWAEQLTYGSHMPPSNPILRGGIELIAPRISQATNGKIEFISQGGGSIVDGKTALDGIGSGLVEAGTVMDLYVNNSLRNSGFISELGLIDTGKIAGSAAVTEMQLLNCPGCQADLAANDVVSLAMLRLSPYYLMCREGIDAFAAIAGKKIAASGLSQLVVVKLGGVPTSLPSTDQYEALQRGLVDCVLAPDYFMSTYNLWDSAKVIFDVPLGAYQGVHSMVVNRDAWEGFTQEERKAVTDSLPDMMVGVASELDKLAETMRAEAVSEHGVTFVKPDADFTAAVEEVRKEFFEQAISGAKEAGIKDADAMAAKFSELVEKWNGIIAAAGDNEAQIKSALHDQIYVKMTE